ncbi:hypothetical protein Sste5346_005193 [Sporothrix stenoceras]|uniref:CBM-cenC domain-containing protein n=1 Tax=Sporothrix stenoceras TaxID=5173 RepID=A0ABR3Z613_9PEZI
MKGFFSILVVGLLAVDGVIAGNCRPSKSASSVSSAPSSASSVSSVSSVSSPSPSPSHNPCDNMVVDGTFTNQLVGWDMSYSEGSARWTTQDCSPTCAHCAELEALDGETTIYMAQDITLTAGVEYVLIYTYYKEVDQTGGNNPTFTCEIAPSQMGARRSARDFSSTSPASPLLHKRVGAVAPQGMPLAEKRSLAGRAAAAPAFTIETKLYTPAIALNTLTCTMWSLGISTYEVGQVIVIPASCPL